MLAGQLSPFFGDHGRRVSMQVQSQGKEYLVRYLDLSINGYRPDSDVRALPQISQEDVAPQVRAFEEVSRAHRRNLQ